MVGDEGGPKVPELIRRIVFATSELDPVPLMAATLGRLAKSEVVLGDVLADCGYSNRKITSWAGPLRQAGACLVMDLHPNDRGMKGTFEGAILANGQAYCPLTPKALFDIGPLRRGAATHEIEAHDKAAGELARCKLSAVTAEDADGYRRVMCPATANKLRCALKPASLQLSAERPSIAKPPESPQRCCTQATITLPPAVNAKTRQKHDYPGPVFRASYARRTAAERTYASLADPSVGGIRRGWNRMFGVAKNTLAYALCAVARNVRIAAGFEHRQARQARAAKAPRRRRRRSEVASPTEVTDEQTSATVVAANTS